MREVFDAVATKDVGRIRTLLAGGIGPDDTDRYGRTPLSYAANDCAVEVAALLIENGADVNHSDRTGLTPLHFACQSGCLAVVEMLVRNGAQVDSQDAWGNTPLGKAVFNSGGRHDVIGFLLGAGADPHLKNHSGVSPYDLAHTISNYDVLTPFRGSSR